MSRLGLGLGLGIVLVLRLGLGLALGLQLGIGIGFRRNHSWSSTFTPRRNHSLYLSSLLVVRLPSKCGDVVLECDFVVRPALDVAKYRTFQRFHGEALEVVDAHHPVRISRKIALLGGHCRCPKYRNCSSDNTTVLSQHSDA